MMKDDKKPKNKIKMPTRNGEIATNNNNGVKKACQKHLEGHHV
jgi:hypothetical protein